MQPNINKLKDELSRRSMMQSIAGLSLGVSATMPNAFSASGIDTPVKGRKKVVRVLLPGGLTHLDSFDPKPQTPANMGGTKTIRSNTGEQIAEFFPEMAKRMDKYALIRSMISPDADHGRGFYLIETSYQILGTIKHPNFGAWMQKLGGKMNSALPSSVTIGGGASAGFLGTDFDPFRVNDAKNPLKGLLMDDPKSAESMELLKLMANVRKDFHKKYPVEHVESYRQFYNDSIKLMQADDLEAFDISKESQAEKKKYQVPHGDKFLLARRLLESDVQYVSIKIGGWDSHFDLWKEEGGYPAKARALDKALATFIDDLYERGMYDDVILTVNSEFGRTPKIGADALGRGHHRKSFTSIIAGAGVKNGTVYGKTDDQGAKILEKHVYPRDFNATLAKLVGLELEKEIYSPDNRPFTIARSGKAVDELIV